MSNYHVNLSLKSFHLYSQNNGFYRVLVFFTFQNNQKQVFENKHGNNGRKNQHIMLKLIHVNATLVNYMQPKFQVISIIFICLRAFFPSNDILLTKKD